MRHLRLVGSIPGKGALWGRLRLAQSILSHRPWCARCAPHARQAQQALAGQSIQQLADEMLGA